MVERMRALTEQRAELIAELENRRAELARERLRIELETQERLEPLRAELVRLEKRLAVLNGDLRAATMHANTQARCSK